MFLFYVHELNPFHVWPPIHYEWIVNNLGKHSLLVIAGAMIVGISVSVPLSIQTRRDWIDRGIFFTFFVSMVTEMFGLPLTIFLLSRFVSVPLIGNTYMDYFGHWPLSIGLLLSFCGLALLILAWRDIYRSTDAFACTGIYRRIRHPQYLAILVVAIGWVIHWPTVATLVLLPILVLLYCVAAIREERRMIEIHDRAYEEYIHNTNFFVPWPKR